MEGFSTIAVLVTKLTRKNTSFVLSKECEDSFQLLKLKLTTTPMLTLPVEGSEFLIYSNVPGLALDLDVC